MTREGIAALKEHFADDLSPDDWRLVQVPATECALLHVRALAHAHARRRHTQKAHAYARARACSRARTRTRTHLRVARVRAQQAGQRPTMRAGPGPTDTEIGRERPAQDQGNIRTRERARLFPGSSFSPLYDTERWVEWPAGRVCPCEARLAGAGRVLRADCGRERERWQACMGEGAAHRFAPTAPQCRGARAAPGAPRGPCGPGKAAPLLLRLARSAPGGRARFDGPGIPRC